MLRRQGAVEGAVRRGGPGAVRGRRRRDNLAPGGDHRRARVPGQDPSQDLEVDLLVTTQTPRGHIAKANQSHFTFHLGRGGSRDHNRRLLYKKKIPFEFYEIWRVGGGEE
uniref:Uncharacterized protein n=1 Tax=Aegilops tauschii subsp. strangulata TaxID=200361 RepID=A0A453E5G3_AEGTS